MGFPVDTNKSRKPTVNWNGGKAHRKLPRIKNLELLFLLLLFIFWAKFVSPNQLYSRTQPYTQSFLYITYQSNQCHEKYYGQYDVKHISINFTRILKKILNNFIAEFILFVLTLFTMTTSQVSLRRIQGMSPKQLVQCKEIPCHVCSKLQGKQFLVE